MDHKTIILSPPPTPNGALHVGHISGPFFRADIYKRLQRYVGNSEVYHLTHTDKYQSYIQKKAELQNESPESLADRNSKQIESEFEKTKIDIDIFGNNNDESYRSFLNKAVAHVISRFQLKRSSSVVCSSCDADLFESFVRGRCPNCLHDCYANVCEKCTTPQKIETLLYAKCEKCGGTNDQAKIRDTVAHSFFVSKEDIEMVRGCIVTESNRSVKNLYASMLPHEINFTYDTKYGFFPDSISGALNPWLEIYFCHLYYSMIVLGVDTQQPIETVFTSFKNKAAKADFIYFFGVDNTYYYAFVFPYISALLHLECFIPKSMKVSYFLQLNDKKISTSRGNVIWASDFLKKEDVFKLRRKLMRSCPEHAESLFSEVTDIEFLDEKLDLQHIVKDSSCNIIRKRLIHISDISNFSVESLYQLLVSTKKYSDDLHKDGKREVANSLLCLIKYLSIHLALVSVDKYPSTA